MFAALSARAEELLLNGDFSDGRNHWLGDGITPAELTPDNPLFTTMGKSSTNELIVPLRPHGWTKVTQSFHTHSAEYNIIIRFKPSLDVIFTKEKDDYDRTAEEVGLWNNVLYHQFNNFLWGIVDDSRRFWFAGYCDASKLKGAHPTLQHTMTNLANTDDKTLYLAFPPGSGNIIIQSVSVMAP